MSSVKVIRPNNIEINKKFRVQPQISTIEESVSKLVKINSQYIQFVDAEKHGNLIFPQMHPLVEAAHIAYSDHLPLILTPDAIWYSISNAVALYVNKHSEELRKIFVNHEGKKRIEVRRDDFVYGRKNPWNEVIDEFSEKIKENTNNNIVDRLQADFSTTTKIARVASQIVIMDAMQKYFEYYFSTMCGIPEIRIEGSKSDWERIKTRANGLVEIIPKFKEWLLTLNEILDKFINVFDDKIDNEFWNEIYKVDGGSGGPYLTGWLIALFPFLKDGNENRFCWKGETWRNATGMFSGLHTDDFDYHLNQVPFIWNYLGNEVNMLFAGGLVGVGFEKDLAVKPVFGYAVMEDKKEKQKNKYEDL